MVNSFIENLEKEWEYLEKEKQRLEIAHPHIEDSFLEIKKNKGKYTQYYRCKVLDSGKKGRSPIERIFIKKSEIEMARKLAQQDFDLEQLDIINNKLKYIAPAVKIYKQKDEFETYRNLTDERKKLIKARFKEDEEFLFEWRTKYSKKEGDDSFFYEAHPINTPYYTNNNERVRSKSEKIIADKLASEGIPYVYEPVTELNKAGMHPDFALLNLRTRKTFYYEHFGMMDNPDYANKAIRKISSYRKYGYEYGDNFIYTFETQHDGLDVSNLKDIIERYLK